MKAVSDFSIAVLKEKCKSYGMATSGTKADLFGRLMERFPAGEWMCDSEEPDIETSIPGEHVETIEVAAMQCDQREFQLMKRQAELAERELALAQRELELLRNREDGRSSRTSTSSAIDRSQTNIASIASLLDYFHGNGDSYEKWERQLRFLKTMYKLDDNGMKVLLGLRLKDKAYEWFHSRPELIELDFEDLVCQMRAMFFHRPSKLVRRKKFEECTWKKGERFGEYFHEKTILANCVPIDPDEIVEYLIDGIPDASLRDQARIQRFDTPASLLDAFGKVTLRRTEATTSKGSDEKRPVGSSGEETTIATRKNNGKRRCHSCGAATHLAADCPTRDKGVKCFGCRDYGHIASQCPRKQTTSKDVCNVTKSADGRYNKKVSILGFEIAALVDTGSELSLMHVDEYIKIGAPALQSGEKRFRGIGFNTNTTVGAFPANVCIDNNTFPIIINVVSNDIMRHRLLIGTDFLDTVELNMKGGNILILPIVEAQRDLDEIPEVLNVDYDCQVDKVNVSYIVNEKHEHEIEKLVEAYRPAKTREIDIKTNIVVKDDQPVYQRTRRLFPSEIKEVDPRVRERINSKLVDTFCEERDELRRRAKENILKTQQANKKCYNKRRKKPKRYEDNDLVAIKRTQLGPGLKLAPKFLGPYAIVKSLRNDRYMVRKVGDHEGPQQTSTSADHMKPWLDNCTDDYE